MKALLFALLLLPSLCFSGGVLPLADYVIKDNFELGLGAVSTVTFKVNI